MDFDFEAFFQKILDAIQHLNEMIIGFMELFDFKT